MKRVFHLSIYCRNDFKNIPLAHQLKKILLRELPYLRVSVKKEGGAPSRKKK